MSRLHTCAQHTRVQETRSILADWTFDLVVLSGLIAMTIVFGRPFTKIGAGKIYVTEVALLLVAVFALRRVGVRGAVTRIRRAVPVVPLVVYWVAGAVATIRGLAGFGITEVTHDVGLAEYSILLPIVAVVADSRARARLFWRTLITASALAALFYLTVYTLAPNGTFGLDNNPGAAVGLYVALIVFAVATRYIHQQPVDLPGAALAAVALTVVALTVVKSLLLGLVAAALAMTMLGWHDRRTRAAFAGIACVVIALAGGLALERLGLGPVEPSTVTPALVRPFTDDFNRGLQGWLTSGRGERIVRTTGIAHGGSAAAAVYGSASAAQARYSLQLASAHYHFGAWVRAASRPQSVALYVTDFAGLSSRAADVTAVARRWRHLTIGWTPPRPGRYYLTLDGGQGGRFLIADVTGGPSTNLAARKQPTSSSTPAIAADISHTLDSGSGGSRANAKWRLAIWRHLLHTSLRHPILGVGFGRPIAFHWHGLIYDARRGDPNNPVDVVGPHNSFINILYRTGLLGLVAVLAVIAIAASRAWKRLHDSDISHERRLELFAASVAFVFALVVASFNVALEGPYMGVYFWTILGLVFVFATMRDDAADASEEAPAAPQR